MQPPLLVCLIRLGHMISCPEWQRLKFAASVQHEKGPAWQHSLRSRLRQSSTRVQHMLTAVSALLNRHCAGRSHLNVMPAGCMCAHRARFCVLLVSNVCVCAHRARLCSLIFVVCVCAPTTHICLCPPRTAIFEFVCAQRARISVPSRAQF